MATLTYYGGNTNSVSAKDNWYIGVSDSSNSTNQNYRSIYKITLNDNEKNNKKITQISLTTGICVTNRQEPQSGIITAKIYKTLDAAKAYSSTTTTYFGSELTKIISVGASGNNITFTFENLSITNVNDLYISFLSKNRSTSDDKGVTLFEMYSKAAASMSNPTISLTTQPLQFTITYNSNGGSGTIDTQTVLYNNNFTVNNGNNFSKEGYHFIGWNTAANGSGDSSWTAGQEYTWTYDNGEYGISNNNVTLYAQWDVNHINIYLDDTNKWQPHDIYIHNGTTWEQYAPFIYDGSKWVPYN